MAALLALGCGGRALGLDEDSGSSGAPIDDPGSTSDASTTSGAVDSSTDSSGAPDLPRETTTGDSDATCGGAPPAEVQPCDPWQQDCPEFHKCSAYASDGNAWDATGCFPVACDAIPIGGVCQADGASGIDDCQSGAMCWDIDPDGIGTCVGLCQGTPQDPTCPDPGDACIVANNDTLNLCLPTCEPSAPECPSGQSCTAVADTFVCAPTVPPSPGSQGQPCGQITMCDPGLQCITQRQLVGCKDVGCCTAQCSLADPDADETCASLEDSYTCVPLNPEQNVGVCAAAPR